MVSGFIMWGSVGDDVLYDRKVFVEYSEWVSLVRKSGMVCGSCWGLLRVRVMVLMSGPLWMMRVFWLFLFRGGE